MFLIFQPFKPVKMVTLLAVWRLAPTEQTSFSNLFA